MDQAPSSSSPDALDASDAPYSGSRDVADALVGAVRRAGRPWAFAPSASLAGHDMVGEGSQTWLLVLPDGEVLGLVVRAAGGSEQHDDLITILLRTFASVSSAERAATDAQSRALTAEQDARIDPLTGLLNRRAWEDALAAESARMRRHDGSAALIVVDIDGLKKANDTDGHLAGDLLIRRTAVAIRGAVRDEDVVARIGGDEFAVLAVESEAPIVRGLLDRIRAALADVEVRASAGAAIAGVGTSLEDAFHQADREMYEAKGRRAAGRRS